MTETAYKGCELVIMKFNIFQDEFQNREYGWRNMGREWKKEIFVDLTMVRRGVKVVTFK